MYLFEDMHHWFKYNDNRCGKADVVLVNSFYDLEKRVIDAVRKEVIGTPTVQVSDIVSITCCMTLFISVTFHLANGFIYSFIGSFSL